MKSLTDLLVHKHQIDYKDRADFHTDVPKSTRQNNNFSYPLEEQGSAPCVHFLNILLETPELLLEVCFNMSGGHLVVILEIFLHCATGN